MSTWKQFLDRDAEGEPADSSAKGGVSRRTFLEVLGYSTIALSLSGCRAPQQKIVPYLQQPVEFTPGVPSWFASVCGGCSAGCGVLVKVRDGRPIKLEGNPDHPLSQGGLCALAHGMVFSLYDPDRLRQPIADSRPATWAEIDQQIISKFDALKKSGGRVRMLTGPIESPTSRETLQKFLAQFSDGKHIIFEAVSTNGIRQAHLRSHGLATLPQYRFEKARLVVSFGADFLGTWIAPVQFTRGYAKARNLQNEQHEMLRHVQFESRMSLTGSNADKRIKTSPQEDSPVLLYLAKLISEEGKLASTGPLAAFEPTALTTETRIAVEKIAYQLWQFKGQSLVVSGSNDTDVQYVVNFINHLLGNYGQTLDIRAGTGANEGGDAAMIELVQQMNAGEISALIISGVNPVYSYFDNQAFSNGLKKVPLKISLNSSLDETSALTDYVCPQSHFLEAWDDAEPVRGTFSVNQPTISPLFQTRAFQESLLRWSGDARSFYEVVRQTWRDKLFQQQKQYANFDEFWDWTLQKGSFSTDTQMPVETPSFNLASLAESAAHLSSSTFNQTGPTLLLYEKISIRDGRYANNPWLQELPDPITKISWDNYVNVSTRYAAKTELEEGQVVRISNGPTAVELPVHIQPGQHEDVIAVALGYGRTKAGKAGSNIGGNAYPFVKVEGSTFSYRVPNISVEKTAKTSALAQTQIKDSMEDRPLIKEISLNEYAKGDHEKEHEHESLWSPHDYPEHKWGMAVDLSACVGCNACVISCQGE
ncbi:MAG TPA: molybdopterin-dependent oxidoreductase, partial [Pyrinomonadaceae bacterium]|nr:molybdopterin-dependent oxidoreductase [Pyrinomonadaceae bacterium]